MRSIFYIIGRVATGWVKRSNPRGARGIFESLIFELNPWVESACLDPARESESLRS